LDVSTLLLEYIYSSYLEARPLKSTIKISTLIQCHCSQKRKPLLKFLTKIKPLKSISSRNLSYSPFISQTTIEAQLKLSTLMKYSSLQIRVSKFSLKFVDTISISWMYRHDFLDEPNVETFQVWIDILLITLSMPFTRDQCYKTVPFQLTSLK